MISHRYYRPISWAYGSEKNVSDCKKGRTKRSTSTRIITIFVVRSVKVLEIRDSITNSSSSSSSWCI